MPGHGPNRTEPGIWCNAACERAIATDNMDCICNGLACVGYGNLELGRIPEALASFEKGIQRSEFSGAMIPKLNGQAGLAMAQFFAGQRGGCRTTWKPCCRICTAYENEVGAANANYMLGRCLQQLGAFDRAEARLNEAVAYYRRSLMQAYLARTLFALADLLDKLGRPSEALTSRSEAGALMKSLK